jgi:Cys-tRNA(Pro)/Cys-tRNA(Cys) deacylase
MTSAEQPPATRASRAAAALGVAHEVRVIERARSLEEAAARLDIGPDQLLKTLVVRRGDEDFLLVLVPGNRQIDWPKLRAHLGVSRLSMPDAEVARDATGYERGTITPFGATPGPAGPWPVIIDASVAGAGPVTVGGGRHGVSLRLDAEALIDSLDADVVDVT